jgi:hypothetical protein
MAEKETILKYKLLEKTKSKYAFIFLSFYFSMRRKRLNERGGEDRGVTIPVIRKPLFSQRHLNEAVMAREYTDSKTTAAVVSTSEGNLLAMLISQIVMHTVLGLCWLCVCFYCKSIFRCLV